jgi:pimeloyl-ACP methyl ester carboxylesterase
VKNLQADGDPNVITVEIDVSEAAGLGERVHATATIVLPQADHLAENPIVAFAVPGAGYNRSYFTFDMPGFQGGGQAGWHANRGWIFVASDSLGVGDASLPDPATLSLPRVTAASHETVQEVLRRLSAGEIKAGFPAVKNPVVLGLGQSMGGGFTIVQQAHHRTFDGIGILGFSAVCTTARGMPGAPPPQIPYLTRDRMPVGDDPLSHEARLAVAPNAPMLRLQANTDRYLRKEPSPPSWHYHYDDVPPEIVARDIAHADGLPEWRSTSVPGALFWMLGPGALAPEAAAIIVPVLSAFGERDVSEDPRMEHKAFRHAVDFSSFICPRMGHMHNFATTRELFWSRIHLWGEHVADLKRRLPVNWPDGLFSDS